MTLFLSAFDIAAQTELDSIKLCEWQKAVDDIQVDSLLFPAYSAKYISYSNEIFSVLTSAVTDSLKYPDYLRKFEPYNQLYVAISKSFFEAEKLQTKPIYDSTILNLYIDGKKQDKLGKVKVFLLTSNQVLACKMQDKSYLIPNEVDSIPIHIICKYKRYFFPLIGNITAATAKQQRKIDIMLYEKFVPCSYEHHGVVKPNAKGFVEVFFEDRFWHLDYFTTFKTKENNKQVKAILEQYYSKEIVKKLFRK